MASTITKVNSFSLRGGVLIIGSLFWQDCLNKRGDDIRKTWRAKHLLVDSKIMVTVPIRYGRWSQKHKVFTMVFSKTVSKRRLGTGYFVPLSKPNITTEEELFGEAIALSRAEGMNGQFIAQWGALGILFNDKRIDNKLKKKLIAAWQNKILNANQFNHKSYRLRDKETPCIKSNGVLNFNWTSPVDKRQMEDLNSYDFILAAVTQPTEYPAIKALSDNVREDKARFYFIENYKCGITTFQDISILNSL